MPWTLHPWRKKNLRSRCIPQRKDVAAEDEHPLVEEAPDDLPELIPLVETGASVKPDPTSYSAGISIELRRLPALLNPYFCCFAKGHKKVVLRSFWVLGGHFLVAPIWRLSQNHHPAYGCRTQIATPPLDAEPKPPPNWPPQAHTCTQPVGTNSCLFPGVR